MTGRSLRPIRNAELPAERAINDFQSETAEIVGAPYPAKARATLHMCTVAVLAAIGLSSVLTLDRVVVADGRIVSKTPNLLVQPLDVAIVRSIDVQTGQIVREGDVIARLDSTFATADVATLQSRVDSLSAEVGRLEAELEGRSYVAAYFAGVTRQDNAILQSAIYDSRKAEYEARMAGFNQRIKAAEALMERSKRDTEFYRNRLSLTSEIEGMRTELERNRVGSRLQSLIASDTRTEIERNLSNSEEELRTASHDIEAIRAEKQAFAENWRATIVQGLVERRGALKTAQEELAKATRRQDLVELRAIEDAVVLSVAKISVGAVLQPGNVVATLVPLDAPVEVEAEIFGRDQGFVKPGDTVQLKLDAYTFTTHGTAKGILRTISEDSFDRRDDGTPVPDRFYRARIEIVDTSTLRGLPKDFRLLPGMPLQADIVVGDRTILGFMTGRITRNFAEGLRDP